MNDASLLRRIRYFLTTNRMGRASVSELVASAAGLGPAFVFGGMLRDLAIYGNSGFRSDVDLVVDTSRADLDHWAAERGAVQNKFGGYRLHSIKWSLDIWRLEDTWAFRAQVVPLRGASDLLRTTFFSWDAIAFDVRRAVLLHEMQYYDTLSRRILDINLEPNPNPVGALIRSLRYVVLHRARLAPRLALFAHAMLTKSSNLDILRYERGSFLRPVLAEESLAVLRASLDEHIREMPCLPFVHASGAQLLLPLHCTIFPSEAGETPASASDAPHREGSLATAYS